LVVWLVWCAEHDFQPLEVARGHVDASARSLDTRAVLRRRSPAISRRSRASTATARTRGSWCARLLLGCAAPVSVVARRKVADPSDGWV